MTTAAQREAERQAASRAESRAVSQRQHEAAEAIRAQEAAQREVESRGEAAGSQSGGSGTQKEKVPEPELTGGRQLKPGERGFNPDPGWKVAEKNARGKVTVYEDEKGVRHYTPESVMYQQGYKTSKDYYEITRQVCVVMQGYNWSKSKRGKE